MCCDAHQQGIVEAPVEYHQAAAAWPFVTPPQASVSQSRVDPRLLEARRSSWERHHWRQTLSEDDEKPISNPRRSPPWRAFWLCPIFHVSGEVGSLRQSAETEVHRSGPTHADGASWAASGAGAMRGTLCRRSHWGGSHDTSQLDFEALSASRWGWEILPYIGKVQQLKERQSLFVRFVLKFVGFFLFFLCYDWNIMPAIKNNYQKIQ